MARLPRGAIMLTNRVIMDFFHQWDHSGELVGKYIMEQCDVDLCYSFILTQFI